MTSKNPEHFPKMLFAWSEFFWRAAALACIFLVAALVPYVPGFYDLLPLENAPRLVQFALLSMAGLFVAQTALPNLPRAEAAVAMGVFSLIAAAGWHQALLLCLFIAAWGLLCFLLRGHFWITFSLFALIAAGGYFLRIQNFSSFAFWWCYVHFVKFLALSLPHAEPRRPLLMRIAFFLSPPFLLGPLVSEYLTVDSFDDAWEGVSDISSVKAGIGLMAWGTLCICLSAGLFALRENPAFSLLNPSSWSNPGDGPGRHLLAGAYIFLFIYGRMAGLTAVALGSFRLLGCEVSYDYNLPFRAKSYLEFCQRYHFNVKNFYSRYVYLPATLFLARRRPWYWASLVGIILSLFALGVAHFYSFVPIPGTPLGYHYSLSFALLHRGWELVFFLVTFSAVRFERRLRARFAERPGSMKLFFPIVPALRWALTFYLVGFFFFNTYAQGVLGWTNGDFFRSMMP
ncbi:MAG: hypothetical protein ACXWR1_06860 [Bdellovibrionota bacterium]